MNKKYIGFYYVDHETNEKININLKPYSMSIDITETRTISKRKILEYLNITFFKTANPYSALNIKELKNIKPDENILKLKEFTDIKPIVTNVYLTIIVKKSTLNRSAGNPNNFNYEKSLKVHTNETKSLNIRFKNDMEDYRSPKKPNIINIFNEPKFQLDRFFIEKLEKKLNSSEEQSNALIYEVKKINTFLNFRLKQVIPKPYSGPGRKKT